MSVESVEVSHLVLNVLIHHAMYTSQAEIMGFLLGSFDDDAVVRVHSLFCTKRSDAQKDRVEVDPVQIAQAQSEAERQRLTVVGWYHSHPRMISKPSSVDLQTQKQFQDFVHGSFIGIIVSAFNKIPQVSYTERLQAIAFQSSESGSMHIIPVRVINRGIAQTEAPISTLVDRAFLSEAEDRLSEETKDSGINGAYGTAVSLVHFEKQLLLQMDQSVSQLLSAAFLQKVQIRLQSKLIQRRP
eukprot:ANDGO_04250.mRNA.1 hypothetical protein